MFKCKTCGYISRLFDDAQIHYIMTGHESNRIEEGHKNDMHRRY